MPSMRTLKRRMRLLPLMVVAVTAWQSLQRPLPASFSVDAFSTVVPQRASAFGTSSRISPSSLQLSSRPQQATTVIGADTDEERVNNQNRPNDFVDSVQTRSLSFSSSDKTIDADYQRGLLTIGFITLLFASNSPVLHAAFSSSAISPPPVLLLNAAVSTVALVGLVLGGEQLESATPLSDNLKSNLPETKPPLGLPLSVRAGLELGLWKFMGTTLNLYGLSLTTASHGAFLIQLTTLIVPIVQGIQGVPIPKRVQASVVLALAGVVSFTTASTGAVNVSGGSGPLGDLLCVGAATFYATYDLRLFYWGKQVLARQLITGKIAVQAMLSIGLLLATSDKLQESLQYIAQILSTDSWLPFVAVTLWSGVAVNAIAPYLQVGGQQAVGPTRCQTIYASQPLWASIASLVFLPDEPKPGVQAILGATAFLSALFLAATAKAPDTDCPEEVCEV